MKYNLKKLLLILVPLTLGITSNSYSMDFQAPKIKKFMNDECIRGLNFDNTTFIIRLLKNKTFLISNKLHLTHLMPKQIAKIFELTKKYFPNEFKKTRNITLEACNLKELPDLFYELKHLTEVNLAGNDFDDETIKKIKKHCDEINKKRKGKAQNKTTCHDYIDVEPTFN